jgi:catechol 2,3-dioxygenase-like lactoylglutathione lyase family enzyme
VPDPVAFNHVGQCVSDLARAKRFYVEVLGFVEEREIHPPDDLTARLLRLEAPLDTTATYLRRDGLVLELLHFGVPGRTEAFRPRSMNEPGLTHISLSVEDLDDVLARIEAGGGEVLHDSDIGNGVFVRDPEGQLIELLPMSYRRALDGA